MGKWFCDFFKYRNIVAELTSIKIRIGLIEVFDLYEDEHFAK